MRRFSFAQLVGTIFLASAVLAQLKVDVSLVNVVATVTADKGLYAADLRADDFIVEEDGQVQTISHLTQSKDVPVSMGITLDTSGSMERRIASATEAVERFVQTVHPDDDIFLMTFSDRPALRQDFTSDRGILTAALRKVNVSGFTALYDALYDSLVTVKKGKHEKKAVLVITDGVDTASYATFNEMQTFVRRSELLVYCIGIAPDSVGTVTEQIPPPPNTGGRRVGIVLPGGRSFPPSGGPINPDAVEMTVLNAFADVSGGKAWLLSGNSTDGRPNPLETILDEIASELRNQYSIGYYPAHPLQDGKWHRVEITVKNPKYHVRARKEYFGK